MIGAPSRLRTIRKAVALARARPTLLKLFFFHFRFLFWIKKDCACFSFTSPSLLAEKTEFQKGMFRSERVDHTNCLQVTIKTH